MKQKKFKSKFEALFAKVLETLGIPFEYEKKKISYVKEHKYVVDFELNSSIIIETKGYFTAQDRQKMLDVRKSNPELDIRFVFMANQKIHKNSPTRYSDWCEKHGFKYHISKNAELPPEWIEELKLKKDEEKAKPPQRRKSKETKK